MYIHDNTHHQPLNVISIGNFMSDNFAQTGRIKDKAFIISQPAFLYLYCIMILSQNSVIRDYIIHNVVQTTPFMKYDSRTIFRLVARVRRVENAEDSI